MSTVSDGKVPVGQRRLAIAAPARTTVIRCLRLDSDIFCLRYAPDSNARPDVLLQCPVL